MTGCRGLSKMSINILKIGREAMSKVIHLLTISSSILESGKEAMSISNEMMVTFEIMCPEIQPATTDRR
uniref:Uncharacterized protein n=1 Tax=Megaselia scalaris TaxID=36166 RepID=T1GBJ3_MEGSC